MHTLSAGALLVRLIESWPDDSLQNNDTPETLPAMVKD